MGLHVRGRVSSLTLVEVKKNNDIKYDYPTLTNTKTFCGKTPHLTYWAGGKVRDSIGVVRVGPPRARPSKKFQHCIKATVTDMCKPKACHQEVWAKK